MSGLKTPKHVRVLASVIVALFISVTLSITLFHKSEAQMGTGHDKLIAADSSGLYALLQGQIIRSDSSRQSESKPVKPEYPARSTALLALTGGIAFETNRAGTFDVYVQNADQSGPAAPLVTGPGSDFTPAWSPDGTQMVFASDRDGDFDIYLRTASGEEHNLTQNATEDAHPSWSPSGDRIIFTSNRGGSYFQIYTMRTDGSDVRQVGVVPGNNAMAPRYSPNGSRIAFMRASITEPICEWNWDVWVMDADGGNQRRVTTLWGADLYPTWTPEGTAIVYASCRDFTDFDLYAVNPDTGAETWLTAWAYSNEWGATYSPDAEHIAFNSDSDGNTEIYIGPAAGGTVFNFTQNSADDLAASWRSQEAATTYSVSGYVRANSGNPISGVIISAGVGHSASTDVSGHYTIAGLITGTYTLTPSKAGWTFIPAIRTVSVPPNATGWDFTGERWDAKRPVVLLPGMGASANWPCFLWEIGCNNPDLWGWVPVRAQGYYRPLIEQLAAAGYTEGNHYLSVLFYDWRKPIADNVVTLKIRIDELQAETGATAVDLIGHSMGGLVARAYVQDSTYGDDVAYLITLGSPHQGAAKTYPYWEAASFYQTELVERVAYSIILLYYMRREINPVPVYTLREVIPSFRDILPTTDYLYDEQHGDQLRPEASMTHRSAYLARLNSDLATLLLRADISTFVGQGLETPVRFYVHDRPWWKWPNWDDGEPNWGREAEFLRLQGDGTVAAASARLPSPAHVQEFLGVNHGDLPGNNDVMSAIFTTLGITMTTRAQMTSMREQTDEQVIILIVDGPADGTVTDPSGRSVGPESTLIPDAEYISDPSDPFKLILIPNPKEGEYEINVQGYNSGRYTLGLLDTFSPVSTVITDMIKLWDISQSQIEPATTVTFVLTYTLETSPTTSLIAETPVIEVPVRAGSMTVLGRALPGRNVEIRNEGTDVLLGSGTTDAYGHLVASLSAPLGFRQRIYPWSNGVAGVSVMAEAHMVYLPAVVRNR